MISRFLTVASTTMRLAAKLSKSRPRVYCSTRSPYSMMSWTSRRQSLLSDTHEVSDDSLVIAGPHALLCHEVNAAPEDLFEPQMNRREAKQPHRSSDLDQDVDVAVRAGLVA